MDSHNFLHKINELVRKMSPSKARKSLFKGIHIAQNRAQSTKPSLARALQPSPCARSRSRSGVQVLMSASVAAG